MGELDVPGVLGRDGHDGAGAVPHQHVVGDEHRDAGAVDRVDRPGAGEDPGLLLVLLPVELGFPGGRPAVARDGFGRGGGSTGPPRVHIGGPGLRGDLLHQRVFRSQHHVGGAEQRVGPGGVDLHLRVDVGVGSRCRVGTLDDEPHLGPGRPADPVALHGLDRIRPVQPVQVVDQPVGVSGDAHHPLAQIAPEHREVADLAAAVGGDLLVRQHRAQPGTPVDGSLADIGEPVVRQHVGLLRLAQLDPRAAVRGRSGAGDELVHQRVDRPGAAGPLVVPGLEQLGEDPLGPAEELRVGGLDAAPGVVGEPEAPQLLTEPQDVGLGGGPWVRSGADGVLLGGQAEGVVADGVQHIAPGHAHVPAEDVRTDVAQRVADVQALARRVGEHVQQVELVGRHVRPVGGGQRPGRVRRVECAVRRPVLLPPCLDVVGQRRGVAERWDGVARGTAVGLAGGHIVGSVHGRLAHGCHLVRRLVQSCLAHRRLLGGAGSRSPGTKNPPWVRRDRRTVVERRTGARSQCGRGRSRTAAMSWESTPRSPGCRRARFRSPLSGGCAGRNGRFTLHSIR